MEDYVRDDSIEVYCSHADVGVAIVSLSDLSAYQRDVGYSLPHFLPVLERAAIRSEAEQRQQTIPLIALLRTLSNAFSGFAPASSSLCVISTKPRLQL